MLIGWSKVPIIIDLSRGKTYIHVWAKAKSMEGGKCWMNLSLYGEMGMEDLHGLSLSVILQ